MTREEIIAKWDGLTPRERDAWIAEVVMGATLTADRRRLYYGNASVPRYTEDISAAWAVFAQFPYIEVARIPGALVTYGVRINDLDDGSVRAMTQADTAPEAIGLAAIIAKLTKG